MSMMFISALFVLHGNEQNLLTYYSKLLYSVDFALVPCSCTVGGATDVLLLLLCNLTLSVPHSVLASTAHLNLI